MSGAEPAPEQRISIARAGRAMATDVSVQLAVASEEAARATMAAGACMAWLAEVDTRLSRFRPESDLSQLNRAAGEWFAASDVLFAAISHAVAAAQASGGLFDPTLLPQITALGYDRDFSEIVHRETISHVATPPMPLPLTPSTGAWRAIELDATRRRIRLPVGTQLDLGGIAKGWAADAAIERYCAPFAHALVNVGGDLRLRGGPASGQAWSVGIRDPRAEAQGDTNTDIATITFSRGGLATSGAVRRWWLHQGRRRHHLIDPRTGAPLHLWLDTRDDDSDDTLPESNTPLIATATALAPTAARAEVATKVALLRGYPAALHAVEAIWDTAGPLGNADDADAGVALVLVLGTGEVVLSANLGDYLATWGTADALLPLTVGSH